MDNLEELVDIMVSVNDRKNMRKLLEEILTRAELTDISKRWYIMKSLAEGKAQREIAQDMEVSLCKITRGSKVLKQDDSFFREILSSMYDETHI